MLLAIFISREWEKVQNPEGLMRQKQENVNWFADPICLVLSSSENVSVNKVFKFHELLRFQSLEAEGEEEIMIVSNSLIKYM